MNLRPKKDGDLYAIICPVYRHTCLGPHEAGTKQCYGCMTPEDAAMHTVEKVFADMKKIKR